MKRLRRGHTRVNPKTGQPVAVREHLITTAPAAPEASDAQRARLAGLGTPRLPFEQLRNEPDVIVRRLLDTIDANRASDLVAVSRWRPTTPGQVPYTYLTDLWKASTYPDGEFAPDASRGVSPASIEKRCRELLRRVGVGNADPDFDAHVRHIAARVNTEPDLVSLAHRYGSVPLVTGETRHEDYNTLGGGYTPHGLLLMLDDTHAAGGEPLPDSSPELHPGRFGTIDQSLRGVIVHEYGHHIHPRIPVDAIDEFYDAWQSHLNQRDVWADWEDRTGGPGAVGMGEVTDPTIQAQFPSVSRRGAATVTEGFAEAVTAVLHPTYEREQFHPNTHRLLRLVEQVIDDEY